MNARKIHYLLHNGKNSNLKYFVRSYLREFTPKCFSRMQLDRELRKLESRRDKAYILQRVDYYNKLLAAATFDRSQWEATAVAVRNQPMTKQSVYYYDAMEIARYFSGDMRWILLSGDITHVPELPTIIKSRPLGDDNQNSVVMKLNKNRHFLFVDDHKSWRDKKPVAVFRGDLGPRKENRDVFMNRHFLFVDDHKSWRDKKPVAVFRGDLGPRKENRDVFMNRFAAGQSPLVDAAFTNAVEAHPEWQKEKMTIGEQLDYKFVMSLEGNDVASNLKWIMSSNSIAVTPRLTCETWFMEGTLIPNYHYIEVRDDFADLEERLTYYLEHPEEAEAIVRHAHEYVDQFRDLKREKLISLLVLKKYFEITNGHYE